MSGPWHCRNCGDQIQRPRAHWDPVASAFRCNVVAPEVSIDATITHDDPSGAIVAAVRRGQAEVGALGGDLVDALQASSDWIAIRDAAAAALEAEHARRHGHAHLMRLDLKVAADAQLDRMIALVRGWPPGMPPRSPGDVLVVKSDHDAAEGADLRHVVVLDVLKDDGSGHHRITLVEEQPFAAVVRPMHGVVK